MSPLRVMEDEELIQTKKCFVRAGEPATNEMGETFLNQLTKRELWEAVPSVKSQHYIPTQGLYTSPLPDAILELIVIFHPKSLYHAF